MKVKEERRREEKRKEQKEQKGEYLYLTAEHTYDHLVVAIRLKADRFGGFRRASY